MSRWKHLDTDLLRQRYRAIRQEVGKLAGSSYDVTNKCNLRCEGCLYFSGDGNQDYQDRSTYSDWDIFFRREAARGVNFAYLAGAEPSLVPERIEAAWHHIDRGVIFTNGTRRIDPHIGFRIHISSWGDAMQATRFRGADTLLKALENYAGDPRAVVIMTLNAQNLSQIGTVAQLCAAHGLGLSFSYFSPTTDYLNRLRQADSPRDDYFRISSAQSNLLMTRDTFKAARQTIASCLREYPETVIYSLAYDDWVTRPEDLYTLDDNGVAVNCGNRLTPEFRHFSVKLKEHTGKCCSPNLSCTECRAYAMGYASFLTRHGGLRDPAWLRTWLDVWETWARLFLVEPVRHTPLGDRHKRDSVA
jgi:MoaA/NifB/PqqE/SkfB family radical SAM enzyme